MALMDPKKMNIGNELQILTNLTFVVKYFNSVTLKGLRLKCYLLLSPLTISQLYSRQKILENSMAIHGY